MGIKRPRGKLFNPKTLGEGEGNLSKDFVLYSLTVCSAQTPSSYSLATNPALLSSSPECSFLDLIASLFLVDVSPFTFKAAISRMPRWVLPRPFALGSLCLKPSCIWLAPKPYFQRQELMSQAVLELSMKPRTSDLSTSTFSVLGQQATTTMPSFLSPGGPA